MKTALITGANRSIGLEAARQLAQNGIFVYIGSRNLENGLAAVEQLKAEGISNIEAVQLDVSDQKSVNEARAEIGRKTDVLDILINNAGISGSIPQSALEYSSIEQTKEVFETNFYGAVRVTQAFVDLMKKSAEPRIVNVTSGLSSQTMASDPANIYYPFKAISYQTSKSALNMYTIILAYELRETNFKVNVVDPGFTKTDFNNHQGIGTVEEAGKRVTRYALVNNEGPTGKFFCEEMHPDGECPW